MKKNMLKKGGVADIVTLIIIVGLVVALIIAVVLPMVTSVREREDTTDENLGKVDNYISGMAGTDYSYSH
jgi:hypothetical protein